MIHGSNNNMALRSYLPKSFASEIPTTHKERGHCSCTARKAKASYMVSWFHGFMVSRSAPVAVCQPSRAVLTHRPTCFLIRSSKIRLISLLFTTSEIGHECDRLPRATCVTLVSIQ
jgi:hypothetical protein